MSSNELAVGNFVESEDTVIPRILKFLFSPNMLDGRLISDLRKVIVHFEKGEPSEYMIVKQELNAFIKATIHLHHNPGKNPHSENPVAKLQRIEVSKPQISGPYWWTVPNLQNNNDRKGAHIIDLYSFNAETVWEKPVKEKTAEAV